MRHLARTVAVSVVAAAVVVIVAGCGSSISGKGGTSPTATGASGGNGTSSATPQGTATALATPSASGTAAAPPPKGFEPASVTFTSPDLGWALGTAPCSSGYCIAILRSSDGGRTWAQTGAPPTTMNNSGAPASEAPVGSGVSELRCADANDCWAFGPDLWATHNGGTTWQRVTIPGLANSPVVTLRTAAGQVYAAVYSPPTVRIASSAVGSDAWTVSPVTLQIGAGPVPSTQLVLSGTAGWLVQVDRVVVGGAKLSGGVWTAWSPPFIGSGGPCLVAPSGADLYAGCNAGIWASGQGIWSGLMGEHIAVSHDGGATFAQAGAPPQSMGISTITSSGPGTVFVGGSKGGIAASFDGGQTWQTVLSSPGQITYIGFTTSTQGVAIVQSAPSTSGSPLAKLFMTRDGGHTWQAVLF